MRFFTAEVEAFTPGAFIENILRKVAASHEDKPLWRHP